VNNVLHKIFFLVKLLSIKAGYGDENTLQYPVQGLVAVDTKRAEDYS